MKIRRALESDLPFVSRMIVQLTEESVDENYFAATYLHNLSVDTVHYFIAEIENRPAGFISLHIQQLLHHPAPVAEVQELCIDETIRGKGIGKHLLTHVTELACEAGCDLIELSTDKKRTRAHKFYDEYGWNQSHFKYTFKFRK